MRYCHIGFTVNTHVPAREDTSSLVKFAALDLEMNEVDWQMGNGGKKREKDKVTTYKPSYYHWRFDLTSLQDLLWPRNCNVPSKCRLIGLIVGMRARPAGGLGVPAWGHVLGGRISRLLVLKWLTHESDPFKKTKLDGGPRQWWRHWCLRKNINWVHGLQLWKSYLFGFKYVCRAK